ncbi:hypothetical protein DK419_20565 [Methylobacterium terrae]|uniref:Uncharacterized protein n=1 Tax=Methylobacterium terrae TaxID=2202827 RepID=A0A2U8WQY9_9HYPH|nr:hypothetical protein [Methylobacterium terrae]AWN48453.1 hypothetical protein DK419_20565 [Methylobacterium terrae]
MTRYAVLAALLAALSGLPARAAGEDAAPTCPTAQAPEFAGGKGFRLWVTRQGTMTLTNPLRPLSPETVQVLQVVIRNKLATAYGPDLSGLRRGPAPAALEAQNGAAIQWAGGFEGLPQTLRILADDGGQVLAELKFEACGDAPKVAEPKPAPTARKGGAARKGDAKAAPKTEAAQGDGAATGSAEAGQAKAAAPRPRPKREKAAAPDAGPARTPGGLMLPQGAIP